MSRGLGDVYKRQSSSWLTMKALTWKSSGMVWSCSQHITHSSPTLQHNSHRQSTQASAFGQTPTNRQTTPQGGQGHKCTGAGNKHHNRCCPQTTTQRQSCTRESEEKFWQEKCLGKASSPDLPCVLLKNYSVEPSPCSQGLGCSQSLKLGRRSRERERRASSGGPQQ